MGNTRFKLMSLILLMLAGACQGHHDQLPGDRDDHRPSGAISASETVRFTGTEPFWGGAVSGTALTYSVPGRPEGERVEVKRFAGRGGISFSGTLKAGPFTLAVTPQACSDGMSDRRYPFMATLQIASEVRQGCAWTDRRPFTQPAKL
ncbi:hypothetical protein WSK_3213 [Novosphingobium sp. Rr 2-17]|uniref:COG3650 family protein n=1 Tax=Novosphingobium sp. Rr 2-17 TaxID=555793 RepID=UPI00026988C5|nr:hypothetical protein [Novosphingobium sp. Rr 2-17]EIZ78238.1 hypothetical protein WSK_3213 [Novosphingobium sp. Rr 2-17]